MNSATIPYVSVVLLVDPTGRILMQHRDANAKASPDKWTAPGGHMETGETPEQTAHREIFEETGLTLEQELTLYMHLQKYQGSNGSRYVIESTTATTTTDELLLEMYIYYTTTIATEDDLILGEGQALAFKTPDEIGGLDLALSMRYALPSFLASTQYNALITEQSFA